MPDKKCPKCGEVKDYSLFYKNKYSKINCSPYCKVCNKELLIKAIEYLKQHE
jgi:uncharacterized protein (DUF983 family)